MHLYRGLHNLPSMGTDSIVTIGTFDGVHLGHQAILKQVTALADHREHNGIVLTFEPQPMEFFRGAEAPVRLTRLREKLILMKGFEIDYVVCLTFNQHLSGMSAEDFIRDILLEKLSAKTVIIGEDFRFGKGREGGLNELMDSGRELGFDVQPAETRSMNGRRISSSWVREALADADLDTVSELLGRRYSLSGRVIHGDERGRELGFPTANISLERHTPPLQGVFATTVTQDDGESLQSVTNIGTRPVFGGGPVLMETHLLDRDEDLYGKLITVEIHKHLRNEQKFDSIAALKDQIARDVEATREYFQDKNNRPE